MNVSPLERELVEWHIGFMGVPRRKKGAIRSRITVTRESSVYTVNREDGFEQYHMDDSCDLYRRLILQHDADKRHQLDDSIYYTVG